MVYAEECKQNAEGTRTALQDQAGLKRMQALQIMHAFINADATPAAAAAAAVAPTPGPSKGGSEEEGSMVGDNRESQGASPLASNRTNKVVKDTGEDYDARHGAWRCGKGCEAGVQHSSECWACLGTDSSVPRASTGEQAEGVDSRWDEAHQGGGAQAAQRPHMANRGPAQPAGLDSCSSGRALPAVAAPCQAAAGILDEEGHRESQVEVEKRLV